MWNGETELATDVDRALNEALGLAYLTVAKELQTDCVEKMRTLADDANDFRRLAQKNKDEHAANVAYVFLRYLSSMTPPTKVPFCENAPQKYWTFAIGFQKNGLLSEASSMISFLSMWVALKEERYDDAWHFLVDAQQEVECALSLQDNESFRQLSAQFLYLESSLFPPQLFASSAHQYGYSTCNICGSVYGNCDHLAGRLYMGEMCVRTVHEITAVDHVAIVRDPADKGLRVPAWPHGDVKRCTLTLRSVGENDGVIRGMPILR